MSLDSIVYWHWWVAALVFLTLEALLPGAVFLWMGASAGVVGLLALIMPALGWKAEFIIFGVLAIAAVFAWRRWRPAKTASDQPSLNRRGQSYVGRQFTLGEAIVNGMGVLRVDDSQWRVSAETDAPAGALVKVVAVDGATLRVERIG
jgi:membrane protein implicated in regulation of membrane protease activity